MAANVVGTIATPQQTILARQRLARCVAVHHQYGAQLSPAGLRLLHAATFSAYLDMRDLGLAPEATAILHREAPR